MTITSGQTILVVEDDEAVRRLAILALRTCGYRTLEAFDGKSGFASFLKHKDQVDLVLTDLVMPVVSGPEMVEQILQVEPKARILFMTGTPAELPQFEGRRVRILHKPFTASRLASSVQDCLTTSA